MLKFGLPTSFVALPMPHPYGWLSLLPSLVAIVLAIVTRRVMLSLLAGIVVGALLTCGGRLPVALYGTLFTHLWPGCSVEKEGAFGAKQPEDGCLIVGAQLPVLKRHTCAGRWYLP